MLTQSPLSPEFLEAVRAVSTNPQQSLDEALTALSCACGPIPNQPVEVCKAQCAELHRLLTASGLVLPLPDLRRQYGGADVDFGAASERKAKEFPLQAALRLHLSCLSAGAADAAVEDPLPDSTLQEVVCLLQEVAVSFADGLHAVLHSVLGPFYDSLPNSVREVYEQLEVVVPLPLRSDPTEDGLGPSAGVEVDGLDSVRPRSTSPVTPSSLGPLHPLLSRKRSLSLCSDADSDAGLCCSQQSAISDSRPSQKKTTRDTTRQVLRTIQSHNLLPEPVDLSSSQTAFDTLYTGGLCLLRSNRKKGLAPRPIPRTSSNVFPSRVASTKVPSTPRTPFGPIVNGLRPPPEPATPPRPKVGGAAVASPTAWRRRGLGARGAEPAASPVALVAETPPRSEAMSRLDPTWSPPKAVVYESE